MRISLNTIKRFTAVELPVTELVTKLNKQLGKVEKVTDYSARYQGAVIVTIDSCEKHENADKLNVCLVNDGSGELTQVVCGAPNVQVGMYVVWLKPGSTVPSTADDKEPFVLGARELRGVMSNGMLASPKELGLGDSHDGILEIDPSEISVKDSEIIPGTSFAEAFGFNDTAIDIENKMFTHRPDLFGQIGVAREISGIQHTPFTSPDWYELTGTSETDSTSETLPLEVFNDATSKVPRFMSVTMAGITVRPSPLWLQAELVRLGSKPINNVVDATNYIMLITAQPTHAYDYDTLRGKRLGARMAHDQETVTLLNGKSYALTPDDIVIADGEGPVGLGGVMGGGESEVTHNTTNIVLEVANFDMYTVRKSSMRHGIFTDALTRFNKGQSPLQNPVVLRRLVELITEVAGGAVASKTHDIYQLPSDDRLFIIKPEFINDRLGLALPKDEIEHLLANVEFTICQGCGNILHTDEAIHYSVPFWRTDIELSEDIVEEVGRLYGFDRLPKELPVRSIKAASRNHNVAMLQSARRRLTTAGANEVLTYSFVHEKIMTRAGQNPAHAYKLSNALSPDLQYYRLGLTPSLLDKVHMNIKAGFESFALYEIGKLHYKGEMDEEEPAVPNEDTYVSLVNTRRSKPINSGAPFFEARRLLAEIVDLSTIVLTPMNTFDMSSDEWGRQLTAPYDPVRSALIVKDAQIWGVIGEFLPSVSKAFKLPDYAAGFEVHSELLSSETKQYHPLSRFPSITQDVSIRTEGASFADVFAAVQRSKSVLPESMYMSAEPTVIYQPADSKETTTTFRLKVTSYDSTLTTEDVRPIIESISLSVAEAFGGRVV